MTVSIIACPSCRNLLLDDTIQCPSCRHVLRPELAARLPEQGEKGDAPSDEEAPCAQCGEMVRHGLVRCWNCGSFMKDEIAATYQRMQDSPAPIIYSAIPEAEMHESPPGQGRASYAAPDDDYDDFELAPEIATDDHFPGYAPASGQNPYGGENSPDYYGLPAQDDPQGYSQEPPPAASGAPVAESVAPSPDDTSATTEAPSHPPGESAAEGEPSSAAAPVAGADDVPHSVATGGDVLLQVALQEEAEQAKRQARGGRRRSSSRGGRGFVVYCPVGHRIEVQEKHRGMTGRCPKCKAPFFVPLKADEKPAAETAPQEGAEAAAAASPTIEAGKYSTWLTDVHHHVVNPTKLKLKPGSLQKEFQPVDVGFSPEGILIATLQKGGGLFGAPAKKLAATRETMLMHLAEGKPVDQLPAAAHQFHDAEAVRKIGIAQPIMYAHESMFAGIEVFGPGQIAVRLPPTEKGEPQFLSFPLSGYRQFAAALARYFGMEDFGEEFGIPLSDQFTELTCHYNETKLPVLDAVEYYQHDPAFQLELIGRKCQGCGLVVSEDARKKEKIGGANGKAIAKAKCPKCLAKFGTISLFTLPQPAPTSAAAADEEKAKA